MVRERLGGCVWMWEVGWLLVGLFGGWYCVDELGLGVGFSSVLALWMIHL